MSLHTCCNETIENVPKFSTNVAGWYMTRQVRRYLVAVAFCRLVAMGICSRKKELVVDDVIIMNNIDI